MLLLLSLLLLLLMMMSMLMLIALILGVDTAQGHYEESSNVATVSVYVCTSQVLK